ncbi:MAG: sigma-70 family RNA polymerase sigma factor [Isosphaeraceae bacterium]|nr:sigma-70 family RNA polymerase sigma factor [Isosphaeraceae bacterium]
MIWKTQGAVRRQFGVLFEEGSLGGWDDGALLDRFLARRDATAEAAFAAVVERHGPMVLRVCNAALGDEHEARDAFQAVFLVLARKARTVRTCETVGPWLYGVAWRVASRVRAANARRRRHERRAAGMAPRWVEESLPQGDADVLLYEEVNRLPAGFREAVILCDLEGLTTDQAAEHLGTPVGTVRSRLHRGRDRLRARLLRRGLAPAAVGAALATASTSAATVPTVLAESTVALAVEWCRAGAVPTSLAWLVKGGRLAMCMKSIATAALVLGLVAGLGGLVGKGSDDRPGLEDKPKLSVSVAARKAGAGTPNDGVNPAVPVPAAARSDHDRLQGTWSVIKATVNGRELAAPNVLLAPMTFKDDTVEFGPFGNPPVKNRYRFRVDPEGEPRALRTVREGANPRWWLYELRGDKLRTAAWLSLDDTRRPRGFDDNDGGESLLILELVREPGPTGAPGPGGPATGTDGLSPKDFGTGPSAPAVPSRSSAAAPANDEFGQLEGTWTVIAREENGVGLPDGPQATVRIAGNTIVTCDPTAGADDVRIETFSIVRATEPPSIVISGAAKERQKPGFMGIYRVDGAVLLLCLDIGGRGRPTEFDTKPGSGRRLIVLRRKQPGSSEPATPAPSSIDRQGP